MNNNGDISSGASVKIPKEQATKISRLRKDSDLNYRSRNDFVVKAVENEIRIATFKSRLSSHGKYHFDLLYAEGLRIAYEKAVNFDTDVPGSYYHKQDQEFKKKLDKASKELKNK